MALPTLLSSLLRFALPGLVVAAIGADNPADALVRGKWVRFVATGKGEATATMCLPASNAQGVAEAIKQLPDRVRELHAAGASVVAVDLDLREHRHILPALLEASRGGKTVLAAHGEGVALGADLPVGHPDMATTFGFPLVLGIAAGASGVPPLAVQALALHEGASVSLAPDGSASVGQLHAVADEGALPFLPYEIPFIHWTESDTWGTAAGRIVVIGACRVDRELTRFGRQPGSVAHNELIETMRDARVVGQVPRLADVGFAGLSFLVAAVARWRVGRLAAVSVGLIGLGLALAISLTGAWVGLSGPLLAGLGAMVWRPPRASSRPRTS